MKDIFKDCIAYCRELGLYALMGLLLGSGIFAAIRHSSGPEFVERLVWSTILWFLGVFAAIVITHVIARRRTGGRR